MSASMRTKRVPEAPWLGEIPSHWEVKPLFTVLRETDVRNTGLSEQNLLSLSYGRIVRKDIDTVEGLLPESFDTYQIVEPGDVVLRLTDLQNDQRSLRVGLVPERGIITSAYVNLRVIGDHDPRFLFYQLHNADLRKVFYNFGGGVRQSMKFADLKRIPIALPPAAEQREIADAIERQLGKANIVAGMMERLLQLAGQLIAATVEPMIAQNVTCSGATIRLRFLINNIEQGSSPQCQSRSATEEEWGVLKVGCVNGDEFDPAENKALPGDVTPEKQFEIRRGDILISRGNSRELVGSAALVRTVRPGLLLSDLLYRIHPNKRVVDPEFLVACLRSPFCRQQIESECKGSSASMPKIGQDTVRDLWIPNVSFEEQKRIAGAARAATHRVSELRSSLNSVIDLLTHYRASIVSDALSGRLEWSRIRSQEAVAACP